MSRLKGFHAREQTAADLGAIGCIFLFVASTAGWALHFNTYSALGPTVWIAATSSGPLLGLAFGTLKRTFGHASIIRWIFWCSLAALLATVLATAWPM